MSTWALLHEGKLKPFSEREKAIWPFRADSWNIPNSPGHHLITTRSRTASCLPGGSRCSISSSGCFFNPSLSFHWIFVTSLLARKAPIPFLAFFLCSASPHCCVTQAVFYTQCGPSIQEFSKCVPLGLSSLGSAINLRGDLGQVT